MPNRMTPVQAAKELGIRPQIVYGFIRQNRTPTYNNPSGTTRLVDFDEVKRLVGGVRHHRGKDPVTGKPVRKPVGVRLGDVLSYHSHTYKDLGNGPLCPKNPRHGRTYILKSGKTWCPHSDHTKMEDRKESPHAVGMVTEFIRDEDNNISLVRVQREDTSTTILFEPEDLAEAIANNRCRVETPENLLAVLMHHWTVQGQTELAVSLADWVEAAGLEIRTLPLAAVAG